MRVRALSGSSGGGGGSIDVLNPDVLWQPSGGKASGTYTIAVTKKPRLIISFEAHASSSWANLNVWSDDELRTLLQYGTTYQNNAYSTDTVISNVTSSEVTIQKRSTNTSAITVMIWY